jgi:hypothetical protein
MSSRGSGRDGEAVLARSNESLPRRDRVSPPLGASDPGVENGEGDGERTRWRREVRTFVDPGSRRREAAEPRREPASACWKDRRGSAGSKRSMSFSMEPIILQGASNESTLKPRRGKRGSKESLPKGEGDATLLAETALESGDWLTTRSAKAAAAKGGTEKKRGSDQQRRSRDRKEQRRIKLTILRKTSAAPVCRSSCALRSCTLSSSHPRWRHPRPEEQTAKRDLRRLQP